MTRFLRYYIYTTVERNIDKTQDYQIIPQEKQFTSEIKMMGNLSTLRGNFNSYLDLIQWLAYS